MKRRIAIAGSLAVLAVSCGAAPLLDMRFFNSDYPPARYQGDEVVRVEFVDPAKLETICGPAPSGMHRGACSGHDAIGPIIVLPNPCRMPRPDLYGLLACHELGHIKGWNATHDN